MLWVFPTSLSSRILMIRVSDGSGDPLPHNFESRTWVLSVGQGSQKNAITLLSQVLYKEVYWLTNPVHHMQLWEQTGKDLNTISRSSTSKGVYLSHRLGLQHMLVEQMNECRLSDYYPFMNLLSHFSITISASGPLHKLFPLPEMFHSQLFTWLIPTHHSGLSSSNPG